MLNQITIPVIAMLLLARYAPATHASGENDANNTVDVIAWAGDFYHDSSRFCSVAEIENIHFSRQLLTINLSVEKHTLDALASMDQQNKDAWLALHCPPETNGIWRHTSHSIDIIIQTPNSNNNSHQLHCRRYHRQQLDLRADNRSNVLRMISNLINRKNSTVEQN